MLVANVNCVFKVNANEIFLDQDTFSPYHFNFIAVDLANLSKKTEMDASRLPIKDLVLSTTVDGRVFPVVQFFQLSPEAKVMISALSKLSNSVLLRQFWTANGDKALRRTAQREGHKVYLSVDDVEQLVWTPSKEKLQSLQERFLNGTISFEEIDKYFNVFKGSQDLSCEIKLITSTNGNQVKAPVSLINQRIEQIDQYYRLHSCIDATESILEFKTCLGLQGNFQLVEDLHNQVSLSFKFFTVSCTFPILVLPFKVKLRTVGNNFSSF